MRLTQILTQFKHTRPLKTPQPQSWVVDQTGSTVYSNDPSIWKNTNNLLVQDYKKIKKTLNLKLQPNQKPIPISPVIGPIFVKDLKMLSKKYRWCSCGMSNQQPFCDGSHYNTSFLPVKFKVVQKCEGLHLCGCKHTTSPPLCSGVCRNLLKSQKKQ